MSDRSGYRITPASQRALAEFRETLPPAGSDLRTCRNGECQCLPAEQGVGLLSSRSTTAENEKHLEMG